MTKTRDLVIAALAGGAAACATQQLVFSVPPASAQQQTLPAWEHRCFAERDAWKVQTKLNEAGLQKWELASAATADGHNGWAVWCMKRRRE